jgi:hypothetical protein
LEYIGISSVFDWFSFLELYALNEERRGKVIQLLRYFDEDLPDISFLPGHQMRGAVTIVQSLYLRLFSME